MPLKQTQNEESLPSSENSKNSNGVGVDNGKSTDINSDASQLQQNRRPSSSGKILGSVAHGLRRTKKKTYSALRGGSSKRQINDVKEEEGEGENANQDDEVEDTNHALETGDLSGGGLVSLTCVSDTVAAVARQSQGIFTPRSSRGSEGGELLLRSRSRGMSKGFGIGPVLSSVGDVNALDGAGLDDIVFGVERTLRKVIICCGFFVAGTIMPESAPLVNKVLELSFVAWVTCVVIFALAWIQGRRFSRNLQFVELESIPESIEAGAPVDGSKPPPIATIDEESSKQLKVKRKKNLSSAEKVVKSAKAESQRTPKRNHDEVANCDIRPVHKIMRGNVSPTSVRPRQHNQLEDLYVMMVGTNERVFPNKLPTKLDNDLFCGEMLLLFRTSEVDEPIPEGTTDSDPVVRYFRGKQRRFEFQWQFKLKKVPDGDVFVCCELDEPVRLGMIQRTLVNTVLKFVKKMNQGFSYFLSDTSENPSYLAFPVGTSMDRFCATKPGKEPPKLGNEIYEDPDLMRKRRKGMKIEWNTEDVYTLALWSAYFDWIDWQILNFPGIRPFSATSVAGVQPIKLTLYSVSNNIDSMDRIENITKHEKCLAIEISNSAKSTLGAEAKKWKSNSIIEEEVTMDVIGDDVVKEEVIDSTNDLNISVRSEDTPLNRDDSINDQDEDDLDDNSEDDDDDDEDPIYYDAVVEESIGHIDTGNLMASGIPLSLREGTGNYVASGGGYAVLQSSPSSSIVLEKVMRSRRSFSSSNGTGQKSHHQMIIRSGDIVRIKLIEPADKDSAKSVKYLSIHRGWWLKWTTTRPKRNGSFYVRCHGANGGVVLMDHPFSLESRRWSHYLVGACVESSTKFGGRMLGIYKKGKKVEYDEPFGEDDGPPLDSPYEEEKNKENRMVPLLLCASPLSSSSEENISTIASPRRARLARELSPAEDDYDKSNPHLDMPPQVPEKRYSIDAPAWIEMMNRTKRTKQLVYVIRVEETRVQHQNEAAFKDANDDPKTPDSSPNFDETPSVKADSKSSQPISKVVANDTYVKLRTGYELAPILQVGLELRKEFSPSGPFLRLADLDDVCDEEEGARGEQHFDFSERVDLERADTFSSSSDDSDSDDEDLDFVIAGPNHDNNVQLDESNENSYAKIWPGDDQLNETCAGNDEGKEIIDDAVVSVNATQPVSDTAVSNILGEERKNSFDEKSISVKKGRSLGLRSRSVERTPYDTAPSAASHPVSTPHLVANSQCLGLDGSGRKLLQYDSDDGQTGDAPRVPDLDTIVDIFDPKKKRTKHSAVLTRVAKTVKSSTVITGKSVLKQGKKVGKGTVYAGKAAGRVIPVSSVVYSYKPPTKHEPASIKRPPRSHRGHKSSIRTVNKALKSMKGQLTSTAASMLPPEESCRKISDILSALSSNNSSKGVEAIRLLVKSNNSKDVAFLRGSSAELGVIPIEPIEKKVDTQCIVARCIWDSHLREELCVVYSKGHHLAFYAPLTKKPSLVVSFEEIIGVRKCYPSAGTNPLPGFHLLSIDTAWRCHYLAFAEEAEIDSFFSRLNDAMFRSSESKAKKSKAQEWENYQMSLETALTGLGIHSKWTPVTTGKKSKQRKPRRILNGRRMAFDVDFIAKPGHGDKLEEVAKYVENLVQMALSFSPDALTASQSRVMDFLDEVSRLRLIPLHEIDLNTKEAFCIFVNIYHCLLQHALLIAVDGLPNKRSVIPFKRCSCYEIGGDVFSLSDLECYVIRGKTSRATHPKPPFVDGAKKSRTFLQYALGATDHRINFVLNNGDLAYPQAVPIFQSLILEEQIETCSSFFLKSQVKIDKKKRTVFLPKVCDVYRNDFGMGDGLVCLSQCIKYLNDSDQLTIAALLNDGIGSISVKFRPSCEQFHANLVLLS